MLREKDSFEDIAIASHQYTKERDYWLNQLSGELNRSCFPYDYPYSKNRDERRDGRTKFHLDSDLYTQLIKLSKGYDYTLHMLLVTVVVVLLGRYSGNEDIILGMPIYRQDSDETFVNTVLALRNRLEDRLTFRDLLLQVRQTIIEADQNQNYAMETLLYQLEIPDASPGFPLFDTAVLLENVHDKSYIDHIPLNTVFCFQRREDLIAGELEYNLARYREETAQQIVTHLICLLERVMAEVTVEVETVEFLTPGEKQQLLFDFNNTALEFSYEKTIVELFAEQVRRKPDQTALIGSWQLAVDQGTRALAPWSDLVSITYRKLNEKSNQLAHLLREKGVRPDVLVGIMTDRTVDTVIGIMGILKSGGAYLPIDPEAPVTRIETILDDAEVPMVLAKNTGLKKFTFTALQGLRRFKVIPFMTAPRPAIPNLDAHPFPDRSLVDYEKYNRFIGQSMAANCIVVQASRGCPYNCAYCHKIWPKKHVFRSAEHIFSEVNLNYQMGMRKFAFVDDIFNLNRASSMKFFRLIIQNGLNKDIQFYFPNGLRGDVLTRDYIDLMVEAGTVSCALALETASPRLQKLIRKNLDLEKFRENIEYICEKYPNLILELFTMLGFPSETEEEAMMTLNFIKSLQWVHFPYINMLIIYPNTDMEELAIRHGITRESIFRSENFAHFQVSDNCALDKSFTLNYRSDFLYNYFLLKERLLHVLPHQMKILTGNEIIQKYNSYLPTEVAGFEDLLKYLGIKKQELDPGGALPLAADSTTDFHIQWKRRNRELAEKPSTNPLKVLLLDLSQFFTGESDFLYDVMGEAPLGMLYLLTYLNHCFGSKINGKIAKSRIDFDSYDELKALLEEFQPGVIGLRSLNIYKDFFHQTICLIRQWGFEVPVITGGPYPTTDAAAVLQDRHVDLVVLGEGEITFCEVIKAIMANNGKLPAPGELIKIPGIAFIDDTVRAGKRQVLLLDELTGITAGSSEANPVPINHCTDLAYNIFTSGSTGQPRGVLIQHRSLHNLVEALKERVYKWYPGYLKVAMVSPFVFDGSVKQVFAALMQGNGLCIVPEEVRVEVVGLFEFYRRQLPDIADGTPAHLGMLGEAMGENHRHPGVKHFLIGGESLSPRVVADFFNRYPAGAPLPKLTNVYGPTESTVDATAYDLPGEPTHRLDQIPIGTPIANCRVYILDSNKTLVPVGVTGELCIGGAGVGRGYLNQPGLTAEKFDHDLQLKLTAKKIDNRSHRSYMSYKSYIYHTGDLATWLPDGNIVFQGRKDRQVKVRGFRIELEEIRKQLLRHKSIKEAVVVLKQDRQEDKYLCAYIIGAAAPGKETDISQLKEYLSGEIPDYMIPTRFVFLEALPLTANGKVNLKALPEPGTGSNTGYIAPRDILEERLRETWSQLLGIEKHRIGINDNFFEIGGHSLKATILISRLHKAFHVKIPLLEIFRGPSIRELAERIRKNPTQHFYAIPLVEKKDYYPLTPAVKQLYFQQQLNPGSIAYNVYSVMHLEGNLEKKRLEDAFRKLTRRHESLRTSFHLLAGEPVQRVHDEVEFEIEYKEVEVKVEESEGTRGLAPLPGELATGNPQPGVDIISSFIRPFDFSRAPLLKVGLVKTGEKEHLLIISVHHTAADGTSIGILARQFMAIYNNEELPALIIQYKDFSQWKVQQLREGGELWEKQEQYWLDQFKTGIPVLNLPCDYPRPARKSEEGGIVDSVVGPEETQQLRELALRENVTLYMLGLSLLNVLLMKLSGQEDIVVGTPNAGRLHADLENLIGMFVNTLAMRNRPIGNKAFTSFLKEVKENTIQAFANQDYGFETLVGRVLAKRDPSRSPLADVFFALQNMELPYLEIPGLRLRPYEDIIYRARFDICLHIFEVDSHLQCLVEYSTRLFKKETIRMFIKNFNEIITAVLQNPEIQLQDIDISTEVVKAVGRMPRVDLGF